MGASLDKADPVHKVTIVPRGPALGLTSFLPVEDVHNYDREYLEARLMVAMGGRAAEDLIFGEFTTGASNDIQQATQTATRMVTQFGMSKVLGPITLGAGSDQHFLGRDIGMDRDYGEDTAEVVDQEVSNLLNESYKKAKKILKDKIDVLHAVANKLIEEETVAGDELRAMLTTT